MILGGYLFLPNYRGSNKIHQGENYQDFLKEEGFLGPSLIIIK